MDRITGWVHPLLKRWAYHVTKPVNGYPPISLMGRIKEQGLVGASIRGTYHDNIIGNVPADIIRVHRVIHHLPGELRSVVETRYLYQGSDKEKAKALGLSKHKYYTWLGKAQTWIAAQLDIPEQTRDNQAQ